MSQRDKPGLSTPTEHKRLPDTAGSAGAADWPDAPDAQIWQTTIEELNVAEEELRQQNDELVAASAALEAERRRYHELFDFAPDCYLVTDPLGVIREANLAAGKLLEHPPARLGGRPLRLYVHPDHRYGLDLFLARLRTGEPIREAETLVRPRDGLAVPVAIHATAERDERGQIVAFRWLIHDLTPLKEAQDQAVQAQRLAAVGQTVAALAHESRNALQRSQACLRLIALEVPEQAKVLEYVARVQKAQDDLARLFEDVRTFTAPPILDRRHCGVQAVWREAWNELDSCYPGYARELSEDVQTGDLSCHADPFRLGQVFRNLFDNALSAGRGNGDGSRREPSRVVVRAINTTLAGRPALRIAIEDNGPGLKPEQRQKLFDPFYTTKPGGMGLGLAIARRVVEAHGGTIAAADADGGGAAFVLMLPRREEEENDGTVAADCGG